MVLIFSGVSFAGETLEVLSPDGRTSKTTMADLLKTVGRCCEQFVNNPKKIVLKEKLAAYSILRRVQYPREKPPQQPKI